MTDATLTEATLTMARLRVAYIDDSPTDRALVRACLEGTTVVLREVEDELALRGALEAGLDLVLSDIHMGDLSGFDVLELVRGGAHDVPVVFLTGTGSEATAVEAMRRGADDYVVKSPHHIRRLPLTLQRVHERFGEARARREAEAERDRFFEFSLELFCVASLEGRFLRLNPAWERVLGWTHDELLATPFLGLVHPEDRERTQQALSQLGQGAWLEGFENRYRRKDGAYRRLAWTSRPVGDRIYAVAQDITDRAAETEALLQTTRLEAVGQLAAGVAHDYRNLLMAVSGYAELVFERTHAEGSAACAPAVEGFRKAVERSKALTAQLLSLTRELPWAPRRTDLVALLGEHASLVRHLLREAGAEVHLELPKEPCWAEVDPAQLERALLNLALNARDAMPDGGSLTLGLETVRSSGPQRRSAPPSLLQHQVWVRDTGQGMPPEVAAQCCQPFFSTKTSERGTGLGLATVEGIVNRAGGRLLVESEVGRGTTVRLHLPALPSSEDEAGQALAPEGIASSA